MPTICHPLIDTAAHIIKAEGVRLETANLQWLRGVVGLIASFTIGHIRLKLVAPPKFSSSAATRGIFPFGFARKPERLSGDLRKPLHKLLCISPAQICDRGVILARRHISTALRRNACVPLTNSDGNLLIAKGLIVTRWIGFSERSSSLPIANVPPGIDTISGISCAVIGAIAGVGDELSLGLSSGTCAGAGTDELPFGVSTGTGAGAGNGCGVLALPAWRLLRPCKCRRLIGDLPL